MLRALKRKLFSILRLTYLGRMFRDIDNYLRNVAIQTGLPEFNPKKVLVLSPHPDDESIGCGGALKLLAARKIPVDVVYMTCGDRKQPSEANDPNIRRKEAELAANVLGVRVHSFLNGQDGELHLQEKDLIAELLACVDLKSYGLVFCPWPYDGHSDHAATFRIFQNALRKARVSPTTLLYETWSPLVANRVVNIDGSIEAKLTAIKRHQSQMAQIDYGDKVLALSRYRSLICRPSEHAEAYFEAPKPLLLNLAQNKKAA